MMRASVYVHFPYCLEKCPYCDFVSYKIGRDAIHHVAYTDAVVREIATRAKTFEGRTIASVFFGGGTPSLWAPRELGRVIEAVRATFSTDADLEVTVECNPTSLDAERAAALANVGVNRLSIGVQSLRNPELKFLGRLHDADGALRAVQEALASPISRVSADLIFGLPEQAPADAAAQVDALAALGLRHMSCYQLTIESGTRFGELAKRGKLPLADDGAVAESFATIHDALKKRGLDHYEISNYAKRGEEARHNLGYWRGEEYLGVGCAAYGFARTTKNAGVRWRNEISPEKYMQNTSAVDGETSEPLDAETLLRERIMLGLRVREGIDLAAAGDDLGVDPWTADRKRAIEWLLDRDRITTHGARITVPRSAWIFCDDTAARLL